MLQSASPRSPMMNWLPIARDFREDLRAALAQAKPTDALEGLASLAACRLGFLETVNLDRALARVGLKEADGFQPIRLAILASSTVDHLAPAIRVAGLRRRLLLDLHSGDYGQYRQDLLDPTSALHRFQPQAVLFSLSAREAIAGVALTASAAEVDGAIGRFVSELRSLWRKAREIGAAVIQQTFMDVSEPLFGGYDRMVPGAPATVIARLNDQMCDAAAARWRAHSRCRARQPARRDRRLVRHRALASGQAGNRAAGGAPLRRPRRAHPRRHAWPVEEVSGPRSRQHAVGRRDRR